MENGTPTILKRDSRSFRIKITQETEKNGIGHFLKGNWPNFETENQWPYKWWRHLHCRGNNSQKQFEHS